MTKISKMETTVNKRPRFLISDNSKAIIFDMITYLFILLFVYTAYSKLTTIEEFKIILGKSPLIGSYNLLVAWTVPTVEILISILLIIPYTKKIGLYGSLFLMIFFTMFLIYGILSGSKLPCHCGGVISSISWKQHIWLNVGFVILAITGLKIYKSQ